MRLFGRSTAMAEQSASQADIFLTALEKTHGIVWFDKNGTVLRVNDQFCDVFGYSDTDVVGKHHDLLIDASRVEKSITDGWENLCNAPESSQILPRLSQGGRPLWINVTCLPLETSQDGNAPFMVQILRDVTAREVKARSAHQQIDAISRYTAKIMFALDGTIIDVNDRFLGTMGYQENEVLGQHHSKFLDADYAKSQDYKVFWAKIRDGDIQSGVFKRLGKNGQPFWLECIYTPVLDSHGQPSGILKIATDVTTREATSNQVDAISRVQAVIEFDVDGHILSANDNFLDAMGYTLQEVQGKHHSIFMLDGQAETQDYKDHWETLRAGKFHSGEFARKHKDGSEIWINATYNPVFGPGGEPVRVVKFASNITPRVQAVRELRKGLSNLAQGNLFQRLETELSPEFEPLRGDFNTAQQRLLELVRSVVQSTVEIQSGTSEISNASTSLSSRTESQAAALEETAAAITQMAASVKNTAQTANSTSETVQKAKTHASDGTKVMSDARSAMGEISTSSSEISKITAVIDDIAFQTNLLALNAGVEAARAGEAGRGFAVVASEVRALAQRSSDAATQIAELISKSSDQVHQGVDLVSRTGDSLAKIERYVSEAADMISNIAAAATEQSGGLSEITASIGELDNVTQKNAAMFEETNAATQLLVKEVESLGQITASFAIDTSPMAPGHRARETTDTRLAS